MGVIGHLRRMALGAGGVALLLPVGVAAGVALTATFGGAYRVGALLQAVNGPAAPAAEARLAAPALRGARAVPAVPEPRRGRRGSGGSPAPVRRAVAAPHTEAPASGSAPAVTTAPAHAPAAPSAGGTGTSTASAPPADPAPAPQPSAVHQSGQQVADAVRQLPAPAGPAAGDAVQSVVDMVP